MLRQFVLGGLLAVVAVVVGKGQDKHEHHAPAGAANAGLEKMKKLAGTWVEADKDGKPTEKVVSVIKVTAGGSIVHETFFPGEAHEMISTYVADGPDLLMTHYCMLGNQPKMKASAKSPADKLNFEFVGGTNLDAKKDKHMHSAVLTILDADHIQIEGVAWENGAPAKEMCSTMKLVRKK